MNRGICWKSANTAITSGRLSFLRRNTILNGNKSVRFMGTSNLSPKEGLPTVQPYILKSNMLVVGRGDNARNLISQKVRILLIFCATFFFVFSLLQPRFSLEDVLHYKEVLGSASVLLVPKKYLVGFTLSTLSLLANIGAILCIECFKLFWY